MTSLSIIESLVPRHKREKIKDHYQGCLSDILRWEFRKEKMDFYETNEKRSIAIINVTEFRKGILENDEIINKILQKFKKI